MMRARKLKEGEVLLDLGDFLPDGTRWWRTDEVDEIIASLKEHMPGHITSVSHVMTARSSVDYQVLHVAIGGISKAEFRRQAVIVIDHYKHAWQQRKNHGNTAARTAS